LATDLRGLTRIFTTETWWSYIKSNEQDFDEEVFMRRLTRILTLCVLAFLLQPLNLFAQTDDAAKHQHMVSVACAPVPAGTKRPEFGCFLVASSKGLQFSQPTVYWHLRAFSNRAAAEAAKSPSGLVVEEEGKVWLSEFGPKEFVPRGGEPVAVVGPLELLPAKTYDADIAYAVLRPGDHSRVHTHPGPEAWYVIAGEQCLETQEGTIKASVGQTMFVKHSIPMELNITGTEVRRSLTLVIHDSTKGWGANSDWKPTGACGK
jgi:quercetin dioxygenase-like cupin family protein